tara:strand:+ start:908 stop:1315 length:408 start_codon:yes stop_codon:yes gene_type:complete
MIKLTEAYLSSLIKDMFNEGSFTTSTTYPEPSDTATPSAPHAEDEEDDEEKKDLMLGRLRKEEKVTDSKIIQSMRDIVAKGQYRKIKGVMVDGFTASLVVKIYDALGDSNKKTFGSLPLIKMVDVAWKLQKKHNL